MYSSVIRWCNNRDDKQPHLKYGLKWVADGSSEWMVISGSVKSFFTIYTKKPKRDNKRPLSYRFMHLAQRFRKVYSNVHWINYCPLISSMCLFTIGSWLARVCPVTYTREWLLRRREAQESHEAKLLECFISSSSWHINFIHFNWTKGKDNLCKCIRNLTDARSLTVNQLPSNNDIISSNLVSPNPPKTETAF